MKREFKKGDRVMVRNNDLEEWQEAVYFRTEESYLLPFIDMNGDIWAQCRHINDTAPNDAELTREQINERLKWERDWYKSVRSSRIRYNEGYRD